MGWQAFFPKVLLCEFLLSLLLKLRMRHVTLVTLGWERANPAFPRRLSSRLSLGGQARHPPLPTRICTLSAQLPRLAPRLRHWHRAHPASVPTAPSVGVATRPRPPPAAGPLAPATPSPAAQTSPPRAGAGEWAWPGPGLLICYLRVSFSPSLFRAPLGVPCGLGAQTVVRITWWEDGPGQRSQPLKSFSRCCCLGRGDWQAVRRGGGGGGGGRRRE